MTRFDARGWLRKPCLAAALAVGVIAHIVGGSAAVGDEPRSRPDTAPAASGTRRALITCGLPGDDEHRNRFAAAVERLYKALTERYGFSAAEVLVRFGVERRSGDGPALAAARGLSSREGIATDVAELRKRLAPEDTLWVIVLGHGHF